MKELNMSTFIQIMQEGFMTKKSQEAAGTFLLNSINNQEYVGTKYGIADLSSKKISNIVNRKSPVPESIVSASVDYKVIATVKKYFDDEVLSELNPHLDDDVLAKLERVIKSDIVISDAKRQKLLEIYENGESAEFLAEVFLYVVNRKNVKIDEEVQYDDVPLLDEANYECPLKHEKLIEYIKDKPIRKYIITQIFPDDLSAEKQNEFDAAYKKPVNLTGADNLIALCEECSQMYLANPTVEEYKKLREIKSEISRNYRTRKEIDKLTLEDNILIILESLSNPNDDVSLSELAYEALKIDDKIANDSSILKNEIKFHVRQYYRYIESVFSSSGVDFDLIASEVKICSMKLEKSGMSQEDVVVKLAEWIRKKAGLNEKDIFACQIVVSFFVQNCEVFYK